MKASVGRRLTTLTTAWGKDEIAVDEEEGMSWMEGEGLSWMEEDGHQGGDVSWTSSSKAAVRLFSANDAV